MLEHTYSGFEVYCDKCGNSYSFEKFLSFSEVLAEMRSMGWISRNLKGEWIHSCPECKKKEESSEKTLNDMGDD